jgi:hypothetical protein
MAIEALKENVSLHQLLGDEPNTDNGLSSDDLKAYFDRPSEIIRDYINNTVVPAVNQVNENADAAARTATGAKTAAETANQTADHAKQAADIALGIAEKTQEAQQKLEQSVADIEATADEAQSTAERANKAVAAALASVQRIEDEQQNIYDVIDGKLPQLTGAKVGQYIEITEVDEKGRVLGFRAVNAPAGGGYGGGDLDMHGSELDNVGVLSLTGPAGDATDGACMTIDDAIDNADGSKTSVINHYNNETDGPVILRNIAPGVEDRDAANVGQLKTRLVAPLTASVGQYIKITAVDDGGKVAAVEAVDAPGGSGGGVHVGPDEPTDENVNVWIDLDDDETKVFVEAPVTAEVGQTIVVKAVDDNGKPTEWEAVSPSAVPFRFIREVIIPEDITTDNSGVSFAEAENGGVLFAFDTDKNGNFFELNDIIVATENASTPNTSNDSLAITKRNTPGYSTESVSIPGLVGNAGATKNGFAQITGLGDGRFITYQTVWSGSAYSNVTSVAKTERVGSSFKAISLQLSNGRGWGFSVGSKFKFWGR